MLGKFGKGGLPGYSQSCHVEAPAIVMSGPGQFCPVTCSHVINNNRPTACEQYCWFPDLKVTPFTCVPKPARSYSGTLLPCQAPHLHHTQINQLLPILAAGRRWKLTRCRKWQPVTTSGVIGSLPWRLQILQDFPINVVWLSPLATVRTIATGMFESQYGIRPNFY